MQGVSDEHMSGRGEQTSTATPTTAAAVGKIDFDRTIVKLLPVKTFNGSLGLPGIAEGDKTETARAAGITIAHHD